MGVDQFAPVVIGLGLALLIAFVVLATVLGIRHERRRRAALRDWAHRNEWRYVEAPRVDWMSRLPGTSQRRVTLALTGVLDGREVTVADYSYTRTSTSTTTGGDGRSQTSTSSTTHHLVVVVVTLPEPGPTLAVERRGGLSKLGRAIFGDKPAALGDERFDSKFRLTGPDPDTIRRYVGPSLAAEHIAGRVPPWSLYGRQLLTYYEARLDDAERILALAQPLVRVAHLLGR
ncbi:hypothetical protein Pa4123_48460 [Phytohabitans aurantiacus]|uniref:Secreted protein n=1 Tax=Phytohabitans aurantiacus TaxID=3016789 RepID=A0ABQ5R1W1_9ACTN|nr:hypothetical protein Pa4123_48460 [Phytohabitans aurantiacus]